MNNVPQSSASHLEMKSSDNLGPTTRRSNEDLDPSDLQCPITLLRDDHFGALFPCLHKFSVSGIRSLEGRSCPLCRSEVEGYESLEGIDTRIADTERLLDKMKKVRQKVATINAVNRKYLVGHAEERNDVKAARFNSALREGDLPRLFDDENAIAIPEERTLLNQAHLDAIAMLEIELLATKTDYRKICIPNAIILGFIFCIVLSKMLDKLIIDYSGDYLLKFN